MKALVCGGRDYQDWQRVYQVLDDLWRNFPDLEIIHGGARGADSAAHDWAIDRRVPVHAYYANWSLGKQAGILRNMKMLEDGKPDMVIAFPGGRGTAHMVAIASKAGVTVHTVT